MKKTIQFIFKNSDIKQKKLLLVMCLSTITQSCYSFCITFLPKIITDAIQSNVDINIIIYTLIIFSILLICIQLFEKNLISSTNKMITFLRFYLFRIIDKKTITVPFTLYQEQSFREIRYRVINFVDDIQEGLEGTIRSLFDIFTCLLSIFLYIITAVYLDVGIFIVAIVFIVFENIVVQQGVKYEIQHNRLLNKLKRQVDILDIQSRDEKSCKEIKIYNAKDYFTKLYLRVNTKILKIVKEIHMKYTEKNIYGVLISGIRDLIIYFMLINMYINNYISVGNFILYVGIIINLSTCVSNLFKTIVVFKKRKVGISDFEEFLKIDEKDTINLPLCQINRENITIQFDHVYYSYDKSDNYIINDLNLVIKPGEKIGLVGDNGSGKTTLTLLLLGIYIPDKGRILCDGLDIRSFNKEQYLSLFSVVFQENYHFKFTIRENVTCSLNNKDDKQLVQSLIRSNIYDDIVLLEQGIDTYLGNVFSRYGTELSGGQLQKLSIARMLYKDSPLMILDEPTSALDPIAEENLYLEYSKLIKGKTSIFISHRLTSTKFCDRIIYLEKGRIVESGTHEELISKEGKYANAYNIQKKRYE